MDGRSRTPLLMSDSCAGRRVGVNAKNKWLAMFAEAVNNPDADFEV